MDNLKNKAAGIAVAVTLGVGGVFVVDQTQDAIPVQCDIEKPHVTDLESKFKTYQVDGGVLQTREMTAKDRGSIKGCEIAKIKNIPRQRISFSGIEYDIEILEMEPIEDGVIVFARAWDVLGKKVGFGSDGTVEIERFRFINPPILVEDQNGLIVRTSTIKNLNTGKNETVDRKLREDPTTALLQALVHTVSIVAKDDKNIQIGKRGNTTTTLYPAAGSNAPVDGYINNNGATYSTVRDATAGNSVDVTTAAIPVATNYKDGATYYVRRAFFGFDTTAVGTDSISSATFSLWGQPATENVNSDSIKVVSATPASQNALVTGDFDQVGSTAYSTLNFASWSTSAYNNMALDSTGVTYVGTFYGLSNHIGFLGTRTGKELANSAPSGANNINAYQADQTGTSNDPKLVLVHSAATASTQTFNDPIFFQ